MDLGRFYRRKRGVKMDKKELKKMWSKWLIDVGMSNTSMAESIGQSQQNLTKKINNGSIRYCELSDIVEKYGYTIEIRKKDT